MDSPTGINKKNLAQVISKITNGDWISDLDNEEHSMLERWIRDMDIGTPERPYLLVTIDIGCDGILALAIHPCNKLKNGKVQIVCPGSIDWVYPEKRINKELLMFPIVDLSSLVALS